MSHTRTRIVVALAVASALASSGILSTTAASADQEVVAGICCSMR